MSIKKYLLILFFSILVLTLAVVAIYFFGTGKSLIKPLLKSNRSAFSEKAYLTPSATKYHYPNITQEKFMDWCNSKGVKYERCDCVLLHLQSFFSYDEMEKFSEKDLLGFIENNEMVCNSDN